MSRGSQAVNWSWILETTPLLEMLAREKRDPLAHRVLLHVSQSCASSHPECVARALSFLDLDVQQHLVDLIEAPESQRRRALRNM